MVTQRICDLCSAQITEENYASSSHSMPVGVVSPAGFIGIEAAVVVLKDDNFNEDSQPDVCLDCLIAALVRKRLNSVGVKI